MNRFGLGERVAPHPLVEDHESRHHPLLTLAYLHWWDKGTRVPADIAARLIEEGYDVEGRRPAMRARLGYFFSSSAIRDIGALP